MIDLDALERGSIPGSQPRVFSNEELRALLAELRAGRDLAEQAAHHRAAWVKRNCGCGVCWALGNYEQATR